MKKLSEYSSKQIAKRDFLSNYSFISLICLIIYAIVVYFSTVGPYRDAYGELQYNLADVVNGGVYYNFSANAIDLFAFFIVPFVVCLLQLSFLHKKSSCYTTLTYGIKRSVVFRNRLLLPLVFMFVVAVVVKLVAFRINVSVYGMEPLLIKIFLAHFLLCLRLILFSAFCAVLASLLCGRFIEAVVAGASIMFLPSMVHSAILLINKVTLFGYEGSTRTIVEKVVGFLNPFDWIGSYFFDYWIGFIDNSEIESDAGFSIASSVMWLVGLSVGFVFLKKYFEKRYKPEKSGFKGANKFASVMISVTLPLAVTAISGNEIFDYYGSAFYMKNAEIKQIAFYLLIYSVCALLCNLVIHLTVKKYKSALISICAAVVVFGAVVGINSSDIFGTYNKLPDPSQIKSIQVNLPFESFNTVLGVDANVFDKFSIGYNDGITFESEEDVEYALKLHKTIIENREENASVHVYISYELKDGTVFWREYDFISDEAVQVILEARKTRAGREHLKTKILPEKTILEQDADGTISPVSVDLEKSNFMIYSKYGNPFQIEEISSAEDYFRLRKTVYEEISAMTNEEWYTPTGKYLGSIKFSTAILNNVDSDEYMYHTQYFVLLPVYDTMVKTVELLKELDYYKHLDTPVEVKNVYIGQLEDVVLYETDNTVTGPMFALFSYNISSKVAEKPDYPVDEISVDEYKELMEDAKPYYYVGSQREGRVILVESEDSVTGLYYIK